LGLSRYKADIDLDDLNSSHTLAVLNVAPGASVLDIGAADGSVAGALAQRGCRVVGVEVDAEAGSAAEKYCERVVIGDVESLNLADILEGTRFDVVLLLDVLEHLRDPLTTLKQAAEQVKPGGRLIISLPNITHAAVRLQLLGGRFEYSDKGLLDRTHLHFFDRQAVERLMSEAGLRVLDRLRTTAGAAETEIDLDLDAFPPETVALAGSDEDAETYQFVYVASPEASTAPSSEPVSLGEALQRRAFEAERARAEAAKYVRTLETRVAELERELQEALGHADETSGRVTSLEKELRERIAELEHLYDELEHVRMDVAVKDAQLAEVRAEFAPLRARLDQLSEAVERHRLIERISAATERFPRVHRALRRVWTRFTNRM